MKNGRGGLRTSGAACVPPFRSSAASAPRARGVPAGASRPCTRSVLSLLQWAAFLLAFQRSAAVESALHRYSAFHLPDFLPLLSAPLPSGQIRRDRIVVPQWQVDLLLRD